jgi:hypothetical protein
MTNSVTIPVSLGGTNVAYNHGTGAYGMASNNGYGFTTYLIPMLSEVIAACALAVANGTTSTAQAAAAAASASAAATSEANADAAATAAAASATEAAGYSGLNGLLTSEAANVVAQRSGANRQNFRVYNTYTNSSNYERLLFGWFDSTRAQISTDAAGTGVVRSLTFGAADYQFWTGGTRRWDIQAAGHLVAGADNAYDIGASSASRPRNIYSATLIQSANQLGAVGQISAGASAFLGWSSTSDPVATNDVRLWRDAAAILAMRNAGAAQAFRIYNTYTDASNYERAFVGWSGNEFCIYGSQHGGTGSARTMNIGTAGAAALQLATSNTTRWVVSSSGHLDANSPNTLDIGASAAPRNIHAGTAVVTPAIRFPATQVASADANTLDDYEEGTFTPELVIGGANVGLTYNVRSSSYTKIGRAVHFQIYIALTTKGSSVGTVTLTGLPFTLGNTGSPHCAFSVWANLLSGLTGSVQARALQGTTTIDLHASGTGTASVLTNAHLTDTSQFMITGTYFV